ncbi:MAG: PKD domain-containing protein [bacterium]|nr:PKD domain-containing protein [bacterium]
MRLPFPRAPLSVALMTLASASLAQSTVILPRQAANPNAIGFPWTFPWGWTGQPYDGTRSQTIYASTELTGQSVAGPILIDSIRWRPHAYAPAVTGGQFRIATLELSSTNVGWSVITGDFAANHGVDRKLVYDAAVDGPVVYQPTPGPTMWQPDSWCVEVPLRQPFYYDPTGGNLVLDVDYPSTSYAGSAVGRLDGMSGSVGTLGSWLRYPEPSFQSTGRAPVIELSYRTVSGTYPVLIADQTRGPTPLTVQFTDLSYSNQPSGITSWAWDFDSDGTIDSTLQNPSHTYTSCGRYDVTLTVDDGVNPPVTITDRDLIATDEITADIVPTPVAVRVLQFTADTSHNATA